jgi:PP-loop superfamily ATP-utilizing enzyme
MQIKYPEIGVCGLFCRLCPMYNTEAESRCLGCKSTTRIAVGCPFITCAVKKKGIEFCWECTENKTCEKWKKHREAGNKIDSFKCYQKLEEDISFIQKKGIGEFEKIQKQREHLLKEMLRDFNEGRSKSYYCIAVTVLDVEEIREVLTRAKKESDGLDAKGKSKVLHSILDELAGKKGYCLKLRK